MTNLCKKVNGKKGFLKKNLKIRTFSEVRGQNVTGNKVLSFGFLFFPKKVWGLPKKSQEKRSQELKS